MEHSEDWKDCAPIGCGERNYEMGVYSFGLDWEVVEGETNTLKCSSHLPEFWFNP